MVVAAAAAAGAEDPEPYHRCVAFRFQRKFPKGRASPIPRTTQHCSGGAAKDSFVFRGLDQGVKKKKLDSRAIFFRYSDCSAPSSSFCGRRAARATSASTAAAAGRRRCCCCCSQRRAPLFSLFLRTVVVFLVFFHSAFQRNLLLFLSRNNPAEIETQISRTRTHPRRNREFRTRGAQPWATRANGNGTCRRRPGREEPEHFHTFLSHYVARHSPSSSSIIFLSLSL